MIAHAKQIDVSTLDSQLPKQRFDSWLRNVVGPRVRLTWETNDCGERTGGVADVGRDIPVCVEVDATLADGRKVAVMIAVGTVTKGIHGRPALKDCFIERGDHQFDTVGTLGELARRLRKSAFR